MFQAPPSPSWERETQKQKESRSGAGRQDKLIKLSRESAPVEESISIEADRGGLVEEGPIEIGGSTGNRGSTL